MKAIRLHTPAGIDNLRPGTAKAPTPGPDEMCVRLRAASLDLRATLVVNGYLPIPTA